MKRDHALKLVRNSEWKLKMKENFLTVTAGRFLDIAEASRSRDCLEV